MKICSKCNKEKENDEFYKHRGRKDGLQSVCKECEKEYKKMHKDKTKTYQIEYRKINKERLRERSKNNYALNKDEIISKNNAYSYSPTDSMILFNQLSSVDSPLIVDGLITVICKNCGKRITPNVIEIRHRINSVNGKMSGENNFYCSDKCRNSCSLFNFRTDSIDPRSKLYIKDKDRKETRNCQTNSLKQLQCDNNGHNYCEKCGDIIDVELHHTHNVAKYGKSAINSAGHVLLCFRCHIEIHESCTV